MSRLLVMFVLAACAFAAGCGVHFASPLIDDDFFTGIVVSGREVTGAPMTVLVTYQTNYPATIDVVCELIQEDEAVREIGRATAPAFPNGNPDVSPMPGAFAFDFVVETPGTFDVECFTPADEDNFARQEINVEQGPDPMPTPSGNELPSTSGR
jgi:hypothetical protein